MSIVREGKTSGSSGSIEMSQNGSTSLKSESKMLQAEEVAKAKVTSLREEAENDTRTIEDPPNPRRVSMTRTAGLPPPPPKFQVPDLHQTHGPIMPVERRHQFPK